MRALIALLAVLAGLGTSVPGPAIASHDPNDPAIVYFFNQNDAKVERSVAPWEWLSLHCANYTNKRLAFDGEGTAVLYVWLKNESTGEQLGPKHVFVSNYVVSHVFDVTRIDKCWIRAHMIEG